MGRNKHLKVLACVPCRHYREPWISREALPGGLANDFPTVIMNWFFNY
jgi:hypothetical protein